MKKKELSICLIKEWNEQGTMRAPSSSKPYQVLELRPVWGGITENDRLVHFLSYCHGNNSCDQSALARADSGRRSPPGCFCELMLETVPAKRQRLASETTRYTSRRTKRGGNTGKQDAFFAVSALWIEGNLSGLPLCDTKTLPMSTPSLAFCLSSHLFILPPIPSSSPQTPPPPTTPPPPCCHSPVLSWMLLCKPSLVERFFCPMLVMHMCKKPLPLPFFLAKRYSNRSVWFSSLEPPRSLRSWSEDSFHPSRESIENISVFASSFLDIANKKRVM